MTATFTTFFNRILIFLLAGAGFAALAQAPDSPVSFNGDRFSLHASNHTLRDVLQAFAEIGVEVQLDPGVAMRIDGPLPEADIEQNLAHLLKAFSYRLSWSTLPGPDGSSLPRLASITVFRPGFSGAVVPLMPEEGFRFAVTTGPDGTRHIRDEVLLGLNPGASADDFKRLVSSVRGVVIDSAPSLGIYRIKLPRNSDVPGVVARLQRLPEVAAAEPNYAIDQPQPEYQPAPGPAPTSPDAPTEIEPGASTVAVLDSGLQPGTELGSALQGAFDATQPGQAIADGSGHGTQMAMLVSGQVTPAGLDNTAGVPMLAIRAFDDQGVASNFSLIQAIDYAAANDARVLSLSWGTETDSEFLARSVSYAQEQGLILVAAAGNEPHGRPVYPAAYDDVLAVGALQPSGELWEQSNRGSFIDLAAAGQAAFPVGHNGPPGNYVGTSIATPIVAQSISRYASAWPEASSQQIVATLQQSLTDAGTPGPDPLYGNGTLDPTAIERFLQTPPASGE